MYRTGLESILGFRARGTRLMLDPCIPREWPGFTITFRHHSARYTIVVENPLGMNRGVASLELDDVPLHGPASIPLVDDAKAHRVRLVLGVPPDPGDPR
jgi:cyclic beta-1,2-glucan synthetase